MLSVTRRQKIKELIQEKKSAKVHEMAACFDVTVETIRRDLIVLEKEGALMRTHGGAFIQSGVENLVDAQLRTNIYVDNKTTIARACCKLIDNGDTIFLDNSTTCYYIARELRSKRLTVATNNLKIIEELADCENIQLICVGGLFAPTEMSFYGLVASTVINQLYFDKCFLSCRSISLEHGLTEASEKWCSLRKLAISRSKKRYLAADFSKFDETSFVQVCALEELDMIITDKPLGRKWHEGAAQMGIEIIDG